MLLRLSRIYGDDELERYAVGVLRLVHGARACLRRSAGRSAPSTSISRRRASSAIIGSPQDEVARAALARFDPNAVVAFGPSEDVPLLAGKTQVDGKPAVYVCERFACRAPVTDPAVVATVLHG